MTITATFAGLTVTIESDQPLLYASKRWGEVVFHRTYQAALARGGKNRNIVRTDLPEPITGRTS